MADFAREKKLATIGTTSVPVIPEILLLFISYAGCSVSFITGLFCLISFISGFVYSGVMNLNIVDISPSNAGTFCGICNTIVRDFQKSTVEKVEKLQ